MLNADKKEARPTQFRIDLRQFHLDRSIGSLFTITLDPGQSMESEINVARFLDMTMPGKYSVTIRTKPTSSLDFKPSALVSNTVEITVVEPRGKYVIKDQKESE